MERVQKILSQAGIASRRASEQLMLDGRVTVNGTTVRTLGTKADVASDDIRVDGRRVKVAERRRYVLLYKPRGYVTTRSDPEQRKTVLDLLRGIPDYVYPVGRLDYESEGLLLLTNDGDLAAQLTHPRHGIARVYEATVAGVPDERDLLRLSRGIVIDGRRTQVAEVRILHTPGHHAPRRPAAHPRTGRDIERRPSASGTVIEVTVREGRNRQVRKMCDAIGHPVDRLKRVAIGPIRDARLKTGHWRELTPSEVQQLRSSKAPPEAKPGARPGRVDRRPPSRSRGSVH